MFAAQCAPDSGVAPWTDRLGDDVELSVVRLPGWNEPNLPVARRTGACSPMVDRWVWSKASHNRQLPPPEQEPQPEANEDQSNDPTERSHAAVSCTSSDHHDADEQGEQARQPPAEDGGPRALGPGVLDRLIGADQLEDLGPTPVVGRLVDPSCLQLRFKVSEHVGSKITSHAKTLSSGRRHTSRSTVSVSVSFASGCLDLRRAAEPGSRPHVAG